MSGNQVGRRTADGGKSKNNMSTPQWGGHKYYKIKQKEVQEVENKVQSHIITPKII